MAGFPTIIQGGMGAGVSDWRLAHAVAKLGQLGVVSGTALDQILARRLQLGDPDGRMRSAMDAFPYRHIAEAVLHKNFIPGGKSSDEPFKILPLFRVDSAPEVEATAVLAAFCEVWLAKQDAEGPVGINLLEKIQLPILSTLYGAMLAGVDYVLVGAGIPWQIPGILDTLARNEIASMRIAVEDEQPGMEAESVFDPAKLGPRRESPLKRPNFLAIVSSPTLAQALLKRATGKINGFVIEAASAGGHNAPPRAKGQFNARGEPVYGVRDGVDLERFRQFGLPFWLAGGAGSAAALRRAQEQGAQGVQIGTVFAFCQESGLLPDLRDAVLRDVQSGTIDVFTDALVSPTGFPFKVIRQKGTLTEEEVYLARERVCDLGYLRRVYRKADGSLAYRCPAQSEATFERAGGKGAETPHRACLCNALCANIGLGQIRNGKKEPPLLTAGDDLANIGNFLPQDGLAYSAAHVIETVLAG
ncbi:nitronate monooxygenase [bacterium]|nr:nitronate monooxygenase [bacterium]